MLFGVLGWVGVCGRVLGRRLVLMESQFYFGLCNAFHLLLCGKSFF